MHSSYCYNVKFLWQVLLYQLYNNRIKDYLCLFAHFNTLAKYIRDLLLTSYVTPKVIQPP